MTDPHTAAARADATSTGAGLFQSRLDIAGAPLIADEPVALGGLGSGPTPFDLLAAALATCTTMTVRLQAQRKGWDIGEVTTHVTHHRVPGETPADRFERQITLAPGLDDATRAALLNAAEHCPVHRTLTAGAAVATRLTDGDVA